MTKEEAIAVFECLATEITAILAGIPKSEAAADQIKRYIDAYDILEWFPVHSTGLPSGHL